MHGGILWKERPYKIPRIPGPGPCQVAYLGLTRVQMVRSGFGEELASRSSIVSESCADWSPLQGDREGASEHSSTTKLTHTIVGNLHGIQGRSGSNLLIFHCEHPHNRTYMGMRALGGSNIQCKDQMKGWSCLIQASILIYMHAPASQAQHA